MPAIVRPVIILVEKSYLDIYATAEDTGSNLEAIDVNDGLYRGFDAQGRLLNIEPYGQQAKITLAEETPSHQEELRQLLKKDLIKINEVIEQDDLPSLIKIAEKHTESIPRSAREIFIPLKNDLIKLFKGYFRRW